MSVKETRNMLTTFAERCEDQDGRSVETLQREIICDPVMKFFPEVNSEVIQYELLKNGLFEPTEWKSLKKILRELDSKSIWDIVKQEYKYLRELWDGPKVSIYIFPIRKEGTKRRKDSPRKNGIAYKRVLFLFVSSDLTKEEIKALVAHEYNHVCRLQFLDSLPAAITLDDSIIIEGLGEFAVKQLYGKKWIAPWTNMYRLEEVSEIWQRHFVPALQIKGVKNHQLYLFGNPNTPFSKWIGYHIGYQIVYSYNKNCGPFIMTELLRKSSDEIIAGSDFAI
ncbi:DUF2268 domain-containing protein [Psychrobacillus psychrodurans]|uniref:DUF2268 domain-containing protein n=1 Tax=Psychrobacillus psychrodurans TaxID=126157 RepID=UPI001F4EAA6B|nr:DUF2268 domain-containing putative Zn-dependent protease [Psychrobacillus psychrodurans]MCK1998253.1 DUF2268 domain-containing protein [Psychrobacillus psychrodurans]